MHHDGVLDVRERQVQERPDVRIVEAVNRR
jgi:hypothetical protein